MGRHIAGLIGDTLLRQSGGQPAYAPMMERRQQQADEQAQWGLRRQADNADWTQREQWKLANVPKINDTERDFNWYKALPQADQAIYDRMHPVIVNGPNGPTLIPRATMNGMTGPAGGTTTTPDEWNSAKPMGGGAGNGTGGFPRR